MLALSATRLATSPARFARQRTFQESHSARFAQRAGLIHCATWLFAPLAGR
jgi:hypothetical protein